MLSGANTYLAVGDVADWQNLLENIREVHTHHWEALLERVGLFLWKAPVDPLALEELSVKAEGA